MRQVQALLERNVQFAKSAKGGGAILNSFDFFISTRVGVVYLEDAVYEFIDI